MLDMKATFFYPGDMLCSSGSCDCAIAPICCVAWGKFRKLLLFLTTKHLSWGAWQSVNPITRSGSTAMQPKDLIHLTCRDPTVMMVLWFTGSVLLRTDTNTLSFTIPETWRWGYDGSPMQSAVQMLRTYTACHGLFLACLRFNNHGTRRRGRPRK